MSLSRLANPQPTDSPTADSTAPASGSSEKAATPQSSFLHGVAWTGSVRWFSQLASWGCTLIVARLLLPSDYGLVAMANVYFGLITMLSEFGLATAIVTMRKLNEDQLRQLNTLSIALGGICCLVSLWAAASVAAFYKSPQLRLVISVMSVSFLIAGFKSVPSALMQKQLRFKPIALVNGCQVILQSLSTIAFAFSGLAYWALIYGMLVGTCISTVLFVWLEPMGFRWPKRSSIRDIIVLSKQIIVSRLSWFVSQNADFVVAGRVLGESALGAYSLAWQLASLPIDKIGSVINQVTPAFFAARQDDLATLRRYLLSITEALILVTLPITLGMALVADDFVPLILGLKWNAAVVPLALLAASTTIRSVTPVFAVLMNVKGESRFLMYNNLVIALVLPIGFLFASRWGTAGIASIWIFALPILASPYYARALKTVLVPKAQYLRTLLPALKCGAIMILTVLITKALMSHNSSVARLTAEVVLGALSYGVTLYFFHWERLRSYGSMLRTLRA